MRIASASYLQLRNVRVTGFFLLALWTGAASRMVKAVPLLGTPGNVCAQSSQSNVLVQKGNNPQLAGAVRMNAYEEAIRLCPQGPTVYNNLAILLLQQQDYATARDWIHRGLAITPHDPGLTQDLGVALLTLGKPEQALPVLQKVPATAKGEFYLGMAYRALRNHAAARQAFARSFALGNNDPYVLYALIEQDRALHDAKDGLQDFQTFSDRFPHSAWLHLLLGNAYAARHDNAGAEAEYRQAVQLDPKLPLAHFQLGRIAFNRSDYSHSFQDFEAEIGVDPTFGEAYLYAGTSLRRLGKNSQALPYLENAVGRDPNSPLTYRELAVAQIQAKRLHEAVKTLEEGERRFPREAAFPAQLARLLKESGDVRKSTEQAKLAEKLSRQDNVKITDQPRPASSTATGSQDSHKVEQLRRCVEKEDSHCTAETLSLMNSASLENTADDFNLKAKALNLLHKNQQALTTIQKAIKDDPHQAAYFITEGRIYQRLGNQVAAMKSFLQAEQIQPGTAPPVYYIGMSFFILGNDYNDNQYYNRAARHFRTALELDPHDDRAEFMLGVVNAVEFKLNEAKSDLEKALKMNPNNAYYYLHYGLVLSRLGDLAGGRREMKMAEKLDPSYARTYFHLGELDAQMGNYSEARQELEAAVRLEPHFSSAYYTLGSVYHHLGLDAKSREAFQKFQEAKSHGQQNEDPVESSIDSANSLSSPKPH